MPMLPFQIVLFLISVFQPVFSQAAVSNTPNVVDVIVVGAGVAGLSTAYRLQKAGISVKVLEMSPHVGGRVRTANYPDGSSAEVGLEEF